MRSFLIISTISFLLSANVFSGGTGGNFSGFCLPEFGPNIKMGTVFENFPLLELKDVVSNEEYKFMQLTDKTKENTRKFFYAEFHVTSCQGQNVKESVELNLRSGKLFGLDERDKKQTLDLKVFEINEEGDLIMIASSETVTAEVVYKYSQVDFRKDSTVQFVLTINGISLAFESSLMLFSDIKMMLKKYNELLK